MSNKIVLVTFLLIAVPYFVSSYEVKIERTAKEFVIKPKDSNNSPTPRVIGGEEVTPHQYPFQAALTMYRGNTSINATFCGGTLISRQWVLTAAHCLKPEPDEILILLGAHTLNSIDSNVQLISAYEYVSHPDWHGDTYQNDVSLVKLASNATLDKYVNVVKLANGTDRYDDKEGITLGWGQTETEDLSLVLKRVTTTVISNDECANANVDYEKLIKSMHICTSGEGPKGSCNGDSGGPLLVDGVQVGIVSFGTTNCSLGLPSVYTRVTEFYDWIGEHAGSLDNGDDDNGDDGDNGDDDDNDDGGASTHSLHFIAIASAVLCLMRSFELI